MLCETTPRDGAAHPRIRRGWGNRPARSSGRGGVLAQPFAAVGVAAAATAIATTATTGLLSRLECAGSQAPDSSGVVRTSEL